MSDQQQAASVKRYDFETFDGREVRPHPLGAFVHHTDYETAIAERDAAQKGWERMTERWQEADKEITRLKSERDAAQRDCERLSCELEFWSDKANEAKTDLFCANRTIKSMGEAADKERREMSEQLKRQIEANDAAWSKAAIAAIEKHDAERREMLAEVERLKTLLSKDKPPSDPIFTELKSILKEPL